MARYAFSSSWNNMPMTSVRQEITNVAMAKPLDGASPIDAGNNNVYLVAIGTNGMTFTMPSTAYVRTTGAVSTSSLTVNGNLTVCGATNGGAATFTSLNVTGPLNVNGAAYKPFIAQITAPADTTKLWVNTSGTVPILNYHNGSTWVSIGAVFG